MTSSQIQFRQLVLGASVGLTMNVAPLILPHDLGAQLPTSPLTDSARLATITTDTGAFAPGHRDFSHYDHPGLCRAAARWTRDIVTKSADAKISADTLGPADTSGNGATAAVARACGARFTLATTTVPELNDLFQLAVQEQNDPLSLAVLAQIVSRDSTSAQRDGSWSNAVGVYLGFGHLTAAESVDSTIKIWRGEVNDGLLRVEAQIADYEAETGSNFQTKTAAVDRVIQQSRIAPDQRAAYFSMLEAYKTKFLDAVTTQPAVLPTLEQQAKTDLSHFSTAVQHGLLPDDQGDWSTMTPDTVLVKLAPEWFAQLILGGKAPAPRLRADYWFPVSGGASRDTVRPVPGKVNLICQGGYPSRGEAHSTNWGQDYEPEIAAHLRRWQGMYGPDLVITLVRSVTEDHPTAFLPYEQQMPWTTPLEQAERLRWYDQTYERLPYLVAIQVEHSTWLPSPDARRMTQAGIQFNQYFIKPYWHSGSTSDQTYEDQDNDAGRCTVIDASGRVVYSGLGDGYDYTNSDFLFQWVGEHNAFDSVLRWLFTEPGASPAAIGHLSDHTESPQPVKLSSETSR